tara:strand:- start:1050 stop:1292 length:243 start_codon:yes stop_codon:yes gene_type:complete
MSVGHYLKWSSLSQTYLEEVNNMKKWYIVQYTIDTIIKADDPLDALVNIQEIASEDLGSRIDDIVWEASKEEIKEYGEEE